MFARKSPCDPGKLSRRIHFPHGSVTITSIPEGAEIFAGTILLGRTPLTVDLPLGKQT